jgi:NifU-like protein involved in Fe-S cluster formation
MFDDLYNNRVLELAADIPLVGRLASPDGSATKTSKLCGSVVSVDVAVRDGIVTDFAIDPKACALGQASAAVLAAHAIGASVGEIRAARDGLCAMLKDNAKPPEGRFWELRYLEGVREYPPRHASTLLAFEAACAALSEACTSEAAG